MQLTCRPFALCLALLIVLGACKTPEPEAPENAEPPPAPVVEERATIGQVTEMVALGELVGSQWVLVAWDQVEPAAPAPEVTLAFAEDRISGTSGCNSYFTAVAAGESPGEVTVGPIGATKKMCAPEAMAVERRFIRLLSGVESVGMVGDRLVLSGTVDDDPVTLRFGRQQ
jgi:heat shock protein HslJ